MAKYMIVRAFWADRPSEIKRRGLTLEQARAHCSGPDGSGAGWFDMYTRED